MNKKYMYGFLFLLVVGFASAGLISYYGQVETTINVESPVEFIGDGTNVIESFAGKTIGGDELKMINNADFPVLMEISDNSDWGVNDGIKTSYFGSLELTKKDVNFDLDKWNPLSDKVELEYTIVGDKFSAEVTEEDIKSGYKLIYYKDNSDRFNEPAEALLVEGNDFPYLPYKTDRNSEEDGTYDYCDLDEYDTCHGAKIWYVPSDAILSGDVLNWDRANEFYFESSLIQYNTDGQIMVYPKEELDFTPEFDVSLLFNETADITTTVTPVVV